MDFLQSKIWKEFQTSVGREVFEFEGGNIIKNTLPIVGDYFYIPRGPEKISSEILDLAKKENVGWIRIEPEKKEFLKGIEDQKVVKAPHDMQPRETFVIDISKSEEELLAEMKQKTRYNLNLAKKKEIKVIVSREKKYVDEFLRLVKITSKRDGIKSHPEEYYRKMVENIPEENLKIYLAKYEGKIIAANIVIFWKDEAIYPHTKTSEKESGVGNSIAREDNNFGVGVYLHGASDNEFRNVMAPYILQWRQIQDAKKVGCRKYDFGGIKSGDEGKSWAGITRFKLGFSPKTPPTQFPGCYDIIINPMKYRLYLIIQKIKTLF